MNVKPSGWKRAVMWASLVFLASCSVLSTSGQTQNSSCGSTNSACNSLSGYSGNLVDDHLHGATIAGGGQAGTPNRVIGSFGSVGGGSGNTAGEGSTVAGGSLNTALYFNAAVGGGSENLADAEEATVGGGLKNTASGLFATVGGGAVNTASDFNATVSGGSENQATYQYTSVGGGTQNLASNVASVVSGGDHNLAAGPYSTVPGGINNNASGNTATTGGGAGNKAAGGYATVPGGFANQAGGDYSFAAGRTAVISADQPGSFLFADASPFPFLSTAADEFAVRATGGVRFITALDLSGAPLTGVRISAGSGSWETLSDVNAKTGFVPVDENKLLAALAGIPINSWSYRGQSDSIRHIGPTAQDFQAAFHIGQDNRYISTVDEEGVALAAIQGLYHMVLANQEGGTASPANDLAVQNQVASLQRQLRGSNLLAAVALLLALVALLDRQAQAKRIKRKA